MGSLDRAVLTGFICRLCSEMHRVVMHIYGEEGLRLCISEKISTYLSINVSQMDPLPKTICNGCLECLENQHRLMMMMERAANMLKARSGRGCGCSPIGPSSQNDTQPLLGSSGEAPQTDGDAGASDSPAQN